VYQSQGDHDLAIADFNEFVRLNPAGLSGFYMRGNSYREKGDLNRAIADYSEAIRLDPRFSFAYHERGVARRMKGEREQAISDFRQAVRLSPDTAGPSRAALESLGVGEAKSETKAEPGPLKRGVLDLLK
jgi:tetratricopeptide (TPR) repeat protein